MTNSSARIPKASQTFLRNEHMQYSAQERPKHRILDYRPVTPMYGTPVDPHCAEAAVTLVPASARQMYLACSTRGNVPPNRLSRTNLCDSRPDDAQRQGSLRPVSAGTAQQQDIFDAALSVDQVLRYRDLILGTEVSQPELWSTV